MDGKSLDVTAQKIEELKALFPEVFSEGKVDFDRLKTALGEDHLTQGEHYELSWAGKTEARKEVQKQTTATLLPDRESSIDFDTAQNVFIEGENLEVLRTLQKAYAGKIKMIYIDPPYNTGNDSFVYPDDYSERREEYDRRSGKTDDEGYLNKQDLWRKNSRESGQFHSVWLSMMYPRLYTARNLMREDGVIFVSIDDNEQSNLKLLMNDVFGEENFVACLVWEKGRKNDAKLFSVGHEYILVYAKSKQKDTIWREEKPGSKEILAEYEKLKALCGNDYSEIQRGIKLFYKKLAEIDKEHPSLKHKRYNRVDKNGLWRDDNISWPSKGGPRYDVIHPETQQPCAVPDTGWRFANHDKFMLYEKNGFIEFREDHTDPPMLKRYLNYVSTDFDQDSKRNSTDEETESNVQVMPSVFYKNSQPTVVKLRQLMGGDYFEHPKDAEILSRLISYVTDKDSIILDFFAGSGTTAEAILSRNESGDGGNQKFILVQLPEPTDISSEAYAVGYKTIADITRARIRKVIQKLQKEREGKLELESNEKQNLGFKAYKLAPSNFNIWRADVAGEDAILGQLELHTQAEKGESPQEAMLYELMLKSGIPLTTAIEKLSVEGSKAILYKVAGGALVIYFDKHSAGITEALLALKPQKVMMLNSSFTKDEDLTNFKLQLKDAGIDLTII